MVSIFASIILMERLMHSCIVYSTLFVMFFVADWMNQLRFNFSMHLNCIYYLLLFSRCTLVLE